MRHATWDGIDIKSRVWTNPAGRMKAGREHRVPLSAAAVSLLLSIGRIEDDAVILPSLRGGALTDSALIGVWRRIGADCVPHGFRSTFRN